MKCNECGIEMIEEEEVEYPYLGIGISTGNIPLGLIPEFKKTYRCPNCGKEVI